MVACGVSVVIITKGRPALVQILLESLVVARRAYAGPSEVVVVDDSSEQDGSVLREACRATEARFVEARSPSVSAKRNQGARMAAHPVLLFLDSDCRAEPGLLAAHAGLYDDSQVHSVLGLVEFEGPGTAACDSVDLTPFAWGFAFPLTHATVSWGPSANFSVRRESFLTVNGFDETFPQRPGGEDVDLGLRLTKAFGRSRCCREAVVYHARSTWNSFRINLERFFQWGVADRYLVVRHPDRTILDLPRIPVILLLVLVASIAKTLITGSAKWLLLPAFLVPVSAIVEGLTETLHCGPSGFGRRIMAYCYFLANESGFLWAALSNGEFRLGRTRLHFGGNQEYGEWVDAGRRVRSAFLAYFIVLSVVMQRH